MTSQEDIERSTELMKIAMGEFLLAHPEFKDLLSQTIRVEDEHKPLARMYVMNGVKFGHNMVVDTIDRFDNGIDHPAGGDVAYIKMCKMLIEESVYRVRHLLAKVMFDGMTRIGKFALAFHYKPNIYGHTYPEVDSTEAELYINYKLPDKTIVVSQDVGMFLRMNQNQYTVGNMIIEIDEKES